MSKSDNGSETNRPKTLRTQLVTATVLSLGGLALLFLGFCYPPDGEIGNSVLVAFGEVATFAGALFGVDYRYKANNNHRKPTFPDNFRRRNKLNNQIKQKTE